MGIIDNSPVIHETTPAPGDSALLTLADSTEVGLIWIFLILLFPIAYLLTVRHLARRRRGTRTTKSV